MAVPEVVNKEKATVAGIDDRRSPIRWWLVLVVAAAGIALRVWIFHTPLGMIDGDEAPNALQLRHFQNGEWNTFGWGNNYGGTLETILATPIYAVWRSPIVLKVASCAMYALACGLTWRIGLRTVGARAAALGAALMWVAPATFVLGSTKGRVYYSTALVLALIALLLCLRLAQRPSRRDMLLLGLAGGLAFWTAPFTVYITAPALGWLLVWHRQRWRDVPLLVPGGIVGVLPFLYTNLHTNWSSLHQRPGPVPSTYTDRLELFFRNLLPSTFGLRLTHSQEWVGGAIGKGVTVLLLVGFAALVVWCALRLRSPLVPLGVIAAAYPFVFAFAQASSYVSEPRYGLFLLPVAVLLVAAGLARVLPRRDWCHLAAMAVIAVAAVGTLASLQAAIGFGRTPGRWDLVAPRVDGAARFLDAHRVEFAYAEYWVAYPITLATRERVVVVPLYTSRHPAYAAEAAAAGVRTYVFFENSAADVNFPALVAAEGRTYRRTPVDGLTVYQLDAPLVDPFDVLPS